MFAKSIKFCSMLIALPAFHLFGTLGFRWPLLSHRAMRGFIADTRRIPSALGYEHSKATEVRTVVRPKTTQGGALWIVCLLQRHLRMTVSNLAHWQYIRNRSRGVAYIRMLWASLKNGITGRQQYLPKFILTPLDSRF
jgi:hypothetical protein